MKNRGFSLIELILVMIVLSIGLTTLILVLRYSTVQSSETHFNTVANWLCQEKLEENLTLRSNSGFAAVSIGTVTENPVSGFSTYIRRTKIYYVDISDLDTSVTGPTDYKRIDVTISGEASSIPVTVSTVISDY